MSIEAAYIYSSQLESSGYPADCPFNTTRAGKAYQIISAMGMLDEGQKKIPPLRPATRAELVRFHHPTYLDALQRAEQGDLNDETLAMGLGTPDCPLFRGMNDYARLVAGASIIAAQMLLDGSVATVFNPWGGLHHAGPAQASGFCYINDVVMAIMTLVEADKKVLYLDLDAHHGDGVQNAFYDSNQVMTISLHESGKTLFPGSGYPEDIGTGAGKGYSVNMPLPVGVYDEVYKEAFETAVLPLIKRFDADMVVLELGLDGLAGDPLTHMHLTNNVYADIVSTMVAMEKPILALGGGGYNVTNTARGWALLWSILSAEEELLNPGLALGGVMLQNTEWSGGLRDRVLLSDAGRHTEINHEVKTVIKAIQSNLFPLHGIEAIV